MTHPYRDLGSSHFWSQSVANLGPHEIDPVVSSPFRIDSTQKVSTMGSCFAQHLSRFLQVSGLNYFVAEQGPMGTSTTERTRLGYGTFSARYGNVYTVRQAVQLFDRAYGRWIPLEPEWRRDNAWVDPFRPQVEPDGFATLEELAADRERHFVSVRTVFEESDVLVLTLGLTEAWCSVEDGAVFPVVAGAAGGDFDGNRYRFANFDVGEVSSDLDALVHRIGQVNPTARLLLTVSPVPLIATFTDNHVLSATTYSKSVLRVAASQAEARHERVHYFPSYEVITSVAAGNRYFAPDLRSVTDEGVAHVMRVFSRHFCYTDKLPVVESDQSRLSLEISRTSAVICDEEVLDATGIEKQI